MGSYNNNNARITRGLYISLCTKRMSETTTDGQYVLILFYEMIHNEIIFCPYSEALLVSKPNTINASSEKAIKAKHRK